MLATGRCTRWSCGIRAVINAAAPAAMIKFTPGPASARRSSRCQGMRRAASSPAVISCTARPPVSNSTSALGNVPFPAVANRCPSSCAITLPKTISVKASARGNVSRGSIFCDCVNHTKASRNKNARWMRRLMPHHCPAGSDQLLISMLALCRPTKAAMPRLYIVLDADSRAHGARKMRIIAGKLRGRRLHAVGSAPLRPTSDRLRETLFDVLAAARPLEGTIWLDLFAGTGAVGIEALSRGAAKVYFVESARSSLALLRKNLAALEISEQVEILPLKALDGIKRLAKEATPTSCDIVFFDPPYDEEQQYRVILDAL